MSLDPYDLENYVPVSNLPLLSKVITSQLNEHVNHNNLHSFFQSTGRPSHSTKAVLLRIFSDFLTALGNKKMCIGVTLLYLWASPQ